MTSDLDLRARKALEELTSTLPSPLDDLQQKLFMCGYKWGCADQLEESNKALRDIVREVKRV